MVIKISLLDCRKLKLEDILQSKYISDNDKKAIFKCNNEEVRIEKAASAYLKNKYIGEYQIDENGKPVSDNHFFNISHSERLVALVMSDVNVGIDIERIRPVGEDLINYISNKEEKEYIRSSHTFFEIWTNKEALVKAYGTGIRTKVKDIPGLPLNNSRAYKDKIYYNKTITYQDYVITVSREKDEDFSLEINKEVI